VHYLSGIIIGIKKGFLSRKTPDLQNNLGNFLNACDVIPVTPYSCGA
jgi:hypothetical protein